jgi:hypothetical protein
MPVTKTCISKRNTVFAVIGVALWIWVMAHAGLSTIMHQLRALRVALPIVVALSLARLLLQSIAWSGALKSEGLHVGLRRLIGIRLASQGMDPGDSRFRPAIQNTELRTPWLIAAHRIITPAL